MPSHPLEPLVRLDGVATAVDGARSACEELRWHRALRRQWAVVRTEAGVRAAHQGLALDGVRLPVDLVRDVARGAVAPAGVEGRALLGALRVQAEVERWMAAPGATQRPHAVPFAQLLARLHAAAVGAPGDEHAQASTGRPRPTGQEPADLHGLGPAVDGPELQHRLTGLAAIVDAPLPARVPALVLAGVVLGELMTLRPFAHANAAVARATFRHLLTSRGVDPVGVVVPEVAWVAGPEMHLSAVARFSTGTADGAARWLAQCAEAVVQGAGEARVVADAVLAGRGLTSGSASA